MDESIDRLRTIIDKYKSCIYSESDFHISLNSIENSITEYELYEFKDYLIKTEASLEHINFMVEEKYRRSEYLKVISQIEEFIKQHF